MLPFFLSRYRWNKFLSTPSFDRCHGHAVSLTWSSAEISEVSFNASKESTSPRVVVTQLSHHDQRTSSYAICCYHAAHSWLKGVLERPSLIGPTRWRAPGWPEWPSHTGPIHWRHLRSSRDRWTSNGTIYNDSL